MNRIDKDKLTERLALELPVMRARLGVTQDEISEIIGISRQTYSSIETRKRKMAWTTFVALLFVFYHNSATRDLVESAGIFTDEFRMVLETDYRNDND